MELEKLEKRLKELPDMIEQLKAERNQLLGYRQALLDSAEESKEENKDSNKK
tara:strand:- start:253 stop:408 length:156 start_codon:yes stop_codon:yes gene_type:complete